MTRKYNATYVFLDLMERDVAFGEHALKINDIFPSVLLRSLIFLQSASTSESNTISVWNNGKGIPVVEHKDEKMYVPALIFGHLLTSSNYDDDEKKVTGEQRWEMTTMCQGATPFKSEPAADKGFDESKVNFSTSFRPYGCSHIGTFKAKRTFSP